MLCLYISPSPLAPFSEPSSLFQPGLVEGDKGVLAVLDLTSSGLTNVRVRVGVVPNRAATVCRPQLRSELLQEIFNYCT